MDIRIRYTSTKNPMFMVCGSCLERCLEIHRWQRVEVSILYTTLSTHFLTKRMTTTLNYFSTSLWHVLTIMRVHISLSTSSNSTVNGTSVGYMWKQLVSIPDMYIEAFSHTLKCLHIKGKINWPIDKCVHLFMKIAKDKSF